MREGKLNILQNGFAGMEQDWIDESKEYNF